MQWVIDLMARNYRQSTTMNKQKGGWHGGEGKRLKYCNFCKKTWEPRTPENPLTYYNDMPTFGLTRKICGQCKNKGAEK